MHGSPTSNGKLRVLHVLEATTAGTAKHVLTLLEGYDSDCFELEVASPQARHDYEEDTRFVDQVHALDVPLHVVDMRRGVNPVVDSVGLFRLFRLIRKGGYDVVHLHSSKAGFLGRVAAKLNGTKTVYTPNGFYFLRPGNAVKRRFFLMLEQAVGRLTDRLIAVSDSEQNAIVGTRTVAPERVAMIPNAIDTDSIVVDSAARQRVRDELGVTSATAVIGTAARYSRQKDPATLVRAAKVALDQHADCCFVWCGEGELRDETEKLARELGVHSAFRFLGFRHDMHDVLNAFDIFALSSLYEGLPYVLLEAMLLGLPVVATDVIGSRDVVENGRTGLLVPEQNGQEFGRALLDLARDPGRRSQMGGAGRAVVHERFAIGKMVAATEDIYRSLAGRPTARVRGYGASVS